MNPDDALHHRARRTYELGRLCAALPWALVVLPLVFLTTLPGPRFGVHLVLIGALAAAVLVYLRWRGQDFGHAVPPGILMGLAGYAVPWLAVSCDLCPLAPSPLLMGLCSAAGATSGLALTAHCLLRECCSRQHMLAAGTTAGLIAAIGCAPAGFGGLAGMTLALVLSGAPALVATRAA